jgi:Cytochrome c7 and related cytochrome c
MTSRKHHVSFVAAVLIAALVGAGAGAASGRPAYSDDGPPSALIFPSQTLPLTFSHAKHLGRAPDLQCVDCHDDAQDSTSAVDLLTPGEDACTMCHPVDRAQPDLVLQGKPQVACSACHPGWDPKGAATQPVARIVIPTPNLKFDHSRHKTTDCKTCHGDLAKEGVGLATRDQLPRMRLCLTCHDDAKAPGTCTTCHLSDVEGRLRTTLPEGQLEPSGVLEGDAHDLDFRMHHKQAAETSGNYCQSCHAERFCSDCHQGVAKPMDFHGGNYVLIHSVEARRGTPDCSACHRTQSFCVACHERSGVGFRADTPGLTEFDPTSADKTRHFHPSGWVDPNGRGANHHAREFQRNPQQCTACHREETCLKCHSDEPGAPRVAKHTHPPGWRGSAQCEALAKRAGRMCLRCHVTADQVGCNWTQP